MKETAKMVNADFTRPITRQIYETINKYNSLPNINHGIIEVVDWKDKENEVTIKISDGNKTAVVTETRQAIYFSLKLLLCTGTLITQVISGPSIRDIMAEKED